MAVDIPRNIFPAIVEPIAFSTDADFLSKDGTFFMLSTINPDTFLPKSLNAPLVIPFFIDFAIFFAIFALPTATVSEPNETVIAFGMLIFPVVVSTIHFAIASENFWTVLLLLYIQFPILNPTIAVIIDKFIDVESGIALFPIPSFTVFAKRLLSAPATSSFPPKNHLNAAIEINTVSKSKVVKKSIPPFKISDHFMFFSAVSIVFLIPSTQTFNVFANAEKSKFLKNPLIPLAIDFPKSLKSNVSPKEFSA